MRAALAFNVVIIEMVIQTNLKGLERMKILTTSHLKVFLGKKYNSSIHTAQNAKATSIRNVYEKTVMKQKKSFLRCI